MPDMLSMLSRKESPVIMGILNVTPDSFSDGGRFVEIDVAIQRSMEMMNEGADIIDLGGESTRPGAIEVSAKEEMQRVVPVIEAIRQQSDVCISIDTSKPEVMQAAVKAGANMVNDVNGLRAANALEVCAELDVPVCVMHMKGKPRTMQKNPDYVNIVSEIYSFLQQRIEACQRAGIAGDKIIIDPGFGFGKSLQHNLQLLDRLEVFKELACPVLVGISRKSMLGTILDGAPVEGRLHASVAAAVLAWERGANVFRVHDVAATADALKVCMAMRQAFS